MASARQWRQASMQAWVISQYTSMGFRAKSYRLEFMVAEGELGMTILFLWVRGMRTEG
jgi:hypothetical protein